MCVCEQLCVFLKLYRNSVCSVRKRSACAEQSSTVSAGIWPCKGAMFSYSKQEDVHTT